MLQMVFRVTSAGGEGEAGLGASLFLSLRQIRSSKVECGPEDEVEPLYNFRIILSNSYQLACLARQTHTGVHVVDDVL